ncbi:hypothetical protein ACTXG6_43800 [Pseudonocardia sp. Cha107L01]|uniref:hypothetical protein n=1 Tax=Pseudonocardia sp. Cha107L01 TaxID=3457576 RepID=UPI00403EF384
MVRAEADRHARAALASEALTRDLEGSRTLNAYSTRELLTRLEACPQLLSQSDDDDIDTTVRTLDAITKKASDGLAAS